MTDHHLAEGWDPYQILNLPRGATAAQIKRNYREKVKGCHPDLGPDPSRVDTFKQVTWAYRVLMDLARERQGEAATSSATPTGGTPTDSVSVTARHGRKPRVAEMLAAVQEKLNAGAWGAAETVARLAVREDSQDPDTYLLLARALAAQGSYAEAIGCLTLALHLDPKHEAARDALSALRHRAKATNEPGR